MEDFKKIDDQLYYATYCEHNEEKMKELWEEIRNNKELMKWSIQKTKNRFGEGTVNGTAIAENILVDYNNVYQDIYKELVDLVYSDSNIARIVLDGYSNGGFSYLLMTLWNPNLKLTEEQKCFAVEEAMNKLGTVRYKQYMDDYSSDLEKNGITDDKIVYTEFGGSINPVGAKTGSMYMANIFGSLSRTQAHGEGEFDIRYWILRNSNWTLEEKEKLIMDFWYDDEEYDEVLEQWEWGIVNDHANYKGELISQFDKYQMYEYSDEDLLELYGDKDTACRIKDEIDFCRQMHELRPQQWELDYKGPKILENQNSI